MNASTELLRTAIKISIWRCSSQVYYSDLPHLPSKASLRTKQPINKTYYNCCISALNFECFHTELRKHFFFKAPNLSCLVSSCLWLFSICVQVLRAVTSSSTTCRRSSPTLRYCRCFCPSGTSSLQRSLLIAPPTRVNASVSNCNNNACNTYRHCLAFRDFHTTTHTRPPQVLWVSTTRPARRLPSKPWTVSRLEWRDWKCS